MKSRADNAKQFRERVRGWAAKLEAEPKGLAVRPMQNKWASCSTAGRLTFDRLVLDLGSELQDYVIVHELLHLSVPNHGKLWKSLMRVYLGDYERLEARLQRKTASTPDDDLVHLHRLVLTA